MNTHKAAMKRAEWLAYCLEIGWDKNLLPGLEKVWDDYYDENGKVKPVQTKEVENTEGKEGGVSEQLYEFVKASEELPNHYEIVFIKYDVSDKTHGGIELIKELIENGWDNVEWLKPIKIEQQGNEAVEFAEWIDKGGWKRIFPADGEPAWHKMHYDTYIDSKTPHTTEGLYKLFKSKPAPPNSKT